MTKIYESFLSTIIPQGKTWVSFDPQSQTLSGEDSTWLVDLLTLFSTLSGWPVPARFKLWWVTNHKIAKVKAVVWFFSLRW